MSKSNAWHQLYYHLLIVITRENSNPRTKLAEPTLYEEMSLDQPDDVQITDPINSEILLCLDLSKSATKSEYRTKFSPD